MYKSLSILTIVAALASGASWAQSSDTETDANTEEASEGAESMGLALGEPEGPQVGQTYVREEFTDWQLRCVKTEDDNDPCQLYQLMRDADGNSVAEINFFAIPPGQRAVAGATVITPLQTLLTEQVRLKIDGGETKRYPFSFCTEVGCFSRLGFTEGELAEFRRGASATVTIVPAAATDQTVNVTMSLAGFTAGYAAVQATLPEQ